MGILRLTYRDSGTTFRVIVFRDIVIGGGQCWLVRVQFDM